MVEHPAGPISQHATLHRAQGTRSLDNCIFHRYFIWLPPWSDWWRPADCEEVCVTVTWREDRVKTYMNTYTHQQRWTQTHTHLHTNIHTYSTCANSNITSPWYEYITRTHTQTQTHTQTHRHTHKHTHTHTAWWHPCGDRKIISSRKICIFPEIQREAVNVSTVNSSPPTPHRK